MSWNMGRPARKEVIDAVWPRTGPGSEAKRDRRRATLKPFVIFSSQ
jgi:hypothetical protein